jgi:crotonobetainyl-CoA:carnitine CoA-transferase CaiB-like acyl-CoA transferase
MSESSQAPIMNAALSGVKVVELSLFDAGASSAKILAWYGADVVKVEYPHGSPGIFSHWPAATKRRITCENVGKFFGLM